MKYPLEGKPWVVEIEGYWVMTPQCAVERDGSVWANVGIGQDGYTRCFHHRIKVTNNGQIKFELNNQRPFLGVYGQPKMTDDDFMEFSTRNIGEIIAHIRRLCSGDEPDRRCVQAQMELGL